MLFENLYNENYSIVYGFLFNLCKNNAIAEDITAETFLKAFSKIKTFDGNNKVSTWLCEIAKNEYFRYYRKHKRIGNIEELADVPDSVTIEEVVQDKVMALKIHKILHNFPEPYKEVFILRVFAELPFKDISYIMDKTETWARVTYYRGKKMILEKLED